MSARRTHSGGADASAIARAARLVTAQITAAAATLVIVVVAASVVFIIDQSQPSELLERPAPGQTKIYVDANQMLVALIVVGVAGIILAGLLSWVIARRAVRPLGEALRIQRTFVADASHELRTPVSVIAARVEILRQEALAGAETSESIGELQRDVRVLGDVIADLLLAAAPSPEQEPESVVSVSSVVEHALGGLRIVAEERGVLLQLTAEESLTTRVPPTTLRRCVVALVDNAIGHSPAGETVDVVVAPSPDPLLFTFTVQDHGTGVHGIDPSRVFERFARGDAAAGSGRVGFGIGLALVRALADRYGGRIEVAETSSTGTTFVLSLPRA